MHEPCQPLAPQGNQNPSNLPMSPPASYRAACPASQETSDGKDARTTVPRETNRVKKKNDRSPRQRGTRKGIYYETTDAVTTHANKQLSSNKITAGTKNRSGDRSHDRSGDRSGDRSNRKQTNKKTHRLLLPVSAPSTALATSQNPDKDARGIYVQQYEYVHRPSTTFCGILSTNTFIRFIVFSPRVLAWSVRTRSGDGGAARDHREGRARGRVVKDSRVDVQLGQQLLS